MEAYVNAKELLAAAKFAYNKDNYERPALLGVMVKVDDKGNYVISSTDGYKAVEFNSDLIDAHASDGECAIPIETIKDNIKTSDSVVHIERVEGADAITMIVYKGEGAKRNIRASVECKNIDTCNLFDKLKKMLDGIDEENQVYNGVAFVNASYLADCCNVVTTAYGKNTPIEFTINELKNKPIMFMAKKEHKKYCRGLLMPVRR